MPAINTEAFPQFTQGGIRPTAENPVSTFSADVDTASWSVVRRSLAGGQLPPAGSVRVEEIVNYFPYELPAPGPQGAPFQPTIGVMPSPWTPGTRLVQVALQGRMAKERAHAVARVMADPGEVSQAILATDGDFNLGLSDTVGLAEFIAAKREAGVHLNVLGFGRGNLDDATMQALAQNGNGQAAFINTEQEARKVPVDQLAGALFPIVEDVKMQVEWDPATVADGRLIGYETCALEQEDFDDDRVDADEAGAGTVVTALYEVRPTGAEGLLGTLRLRWKEPGEGSSLPMEGEIRPDAPAGSEARFAAAIAGFGQLLRNSPSVRVGAMTRRWLWPARTGVPIPSDTGPRPCR